MKYFRMSYEEVVFNRSYINIILLNRSIPSFKTKDDDGGYHSTRNRRNNNQPKRSFKAINKPTSANDFFMAMMG